MGRHDAHHPRKNQAAGAGAPHPIERALDTEAGCEQVKHLIAGARGAMADLMAEVVEDHVRTHLVDANKHPHAPNN
jgi:FrmR/RcnR family transcriptional regulator, repressor of frmRAB operon